MSITSGTMRNIKVTDKDGNIFNMAPVDSEARQAIDEAKNLQFDEDYFTSELSQDETELSIGLNGVPIGVESPLKFIQDDDQGIVIGSDALTQSSADTLYQPIGDYATTGTVDSISTDVGALKTASSTWNNVTNKLDSTAAFTKSSADTLYAPIGTTASITSVTTNNYISGNGTNSSPLGLSNSANIHDLSAGRLLIEYNDVSSRFRGYEISMADGTNILRFDNIGITADNVSITWHDLITKVNAL